MRVPRVLIEISLGERASSARLVDHRRADFQHALVVEHFLQRARRTVDAAARAYADNEFDILDRFPPRLCCAIRNPESGNKDSSQSVKRAVWHGIILYGIPITARNRM